MALWLKRQQPVLLHQSSEIPYVIKKNGVFLCFDNFYGEVRNASEHHISFYMPRNSLRRRSTYYFKINPFPITIPFDHVHELDNVIVDGKIRKRQSEVVGDSVDIVVAKASYIRRLNGDGFDEFNDLIEKFDHVFILTGEEIDPQVRLLDDVANVIQHRNWYRTSVKIADSICNLSDYKYCWTSAIPELAISCYGLKKNDELSIIQEVFQNIDVPQFSISWED